MNYRQLPTGENLSQLAYGIMRMPVTDTGAKSEDIDYATAEKLIDAAVANGINYFDTAWPYHDGQSESFLGEALVARYPRENFYLATKLPVWEIDSPAQADEVFAKQQTKLQTDHFDFYLMHALDGARLDKMLAAGIIDWAREKQASGAITRLGFSFHGTIEDMERIIEAHSWDFSMLQLNYMDWEMQKAGQAYQLLTEAGIPVFAMEPVRGGKLAELPPAATEILQTVWPERSSASWGFRYVASLPNVYAILSGMTTAAQMKDNLATFSLPADQIPLTSREREVLDKALEASNLAAAIPCTNCNYCMPCPFDVEIPRVLSAYNALKMGGTAFGYLNSIKVLGDQGTADNCVDCGECEPQCPQHIAIPREMERIAAETETLQTEEDFLEARAATIAQRESK
ncbi:MAG: aldo/keto reductase [Coriobacteriia bacterium]|nr:aldo/keto reductase [Coriobacteriia bacterium]MCL2537097.1 aldo/keto reductase [Coriobacteriia bacterium]